MMSDTFYCTTRDDKGKEVMVTVSKEFGLVKFQPPSGHEIVLELYDLMQTLKWIEKLR